MIKVELYQPVMIVGQHIRPTRGEIVKIGRTWIEVLPNWSATLRTRRFRLDDQTDGSKIGVPDRFSILDDKYATTQED